jgi:hypothetical protein
VRWLGASYEPDSPWVEVGYRVRDGQKARDCLFDWSVVVLKRGARLVVTGSHLRLPPCQARASGAPGKRGGAQLA